MRKRCTLPTDSNYPKYGGRGITMCERWNSVENFIADMGKRPSLDHTLDRKDTNGNYEPDNCRWATKTEQSNNRRNVKTVTHDGRSLTITQWAAITGVDVKTLWARLYVHGWTVARALRVAPIPGGNYDKAATL